MAGVWLMFEGPTSKIVLGIFMLSDFRGSEATLGTLVLHELVPDEGVLGGYRT